MIWRTTTPDWDRIRHGRCPARARVRPSRSVPSRIRRPSARLRPIGESQEEIRQLLSGARRGLTEVIEAGVIDPGMAPGEAIHPLLSMWRGIIAEHLGKETSVRFTTVASHDSCRPPSPYFR